MLLMGNIFGVYGKFTHHQLYIMPRPKILPLDEFVRARTWIGEMVNWLDMGGPMGSRGAAAIYSEHGM